MSCLLLPYNLGKKLIYQTITTYIYEFTQAQLQTKTVNVEMTNLSEEDLTIFFQIMFTQRLPLYDREAFKFHD